MNRITLLVVSVAFASLSPQGVSAQEPQEPVSAVATTQTPDIDTPAPEKHSVFSRLRRWTKDVQLIERMNGDVTGWYPRIGGITRGSGFGGGPGYRHPMAGDALFLDLSGALSIKGYSALDARVRWLQVFHRRVELWTDLRFEDFPEEDFFGTGMATLESSRTSYDYDSTDARVRGVFRPSLWSRVTTMVGFVRPDVGSGGDSSYPSTEALFTDAEAPGLFEQPHYIQTTIIGEIDYRDTPGNTTQGGYYRVAVGQWNDVSLDRYNFHRVDAQLAQYVPLTPGRAHVLVGRVGTTFVDSEAGSRVPFYYQAYVGGLDTIRSFREFRFKDTSALWLTGEYKWRPTESLSVSVFADTGTVSSTWTGFTRHEMRPGYGAGIGVHGPRGTIARVDVASGGGEGWQVIIKLKPTF